MAKDIILDNNNELLIKDGDFVIGDSEMQDVSIILQMNPGDLKSDPILGVGLVSKIKQKVSPNELEALVKLHLKRDNKDYSAIKNRLKFNLNEI